MRKRIIRSSNPPPMQGEMVLMSFNVAPPYDGKLEKPDIRNLMLMSR